MEDLIVLVICGVLSALTWFVAVAVYRSTFDGPDPAATPGYWTTARAAVVAVTLACYFPNPWDYGLSVAAWTAAVVGFLHLPAGRSAVLVSYLALGSFLVRLIIVGALET